MTTMTKIKFTITLGAKTLKALEAIGTSPEELKDELIEMIQERLQEVRDEGGEDDA